AAGAFGCLRCVVRTPYPRRAAAGCRRLYPIYPAGARAMSRSTRQSTEGFSLPARLLHWLMAAGIIAMLFIGVGMVASVSERHQWLIQIHKPLGLALLALACLRLARRLYGGAPALPADLPAWQRQAAHASHLLLYALM